VSLTSVSLEEWQILQPVHGSDLAGRGFGANEADRQLAERLTSTGRIEVLELARGLELRATSYVGRFRLGEIEVTVNPKLTGAPLLHLLRYAYGLRHLELYKPVGYAAEKWSFQELIVQQLAAEVGEILARGTHRDYLLTHADLSSPRGRIDFNRFARDAHTTKATLPCIHHPRTEDNLLNQALLGGLQFAVRLTTNVDLRAHLYRLMKTLSIDVSSRLLDTRLLNDARRTMDRRTTAYEAALRIIELLLNAEGVALHNHAEQVTLPGFLFDMNRFFQALMSRFLRDHLVNVVLYDEYRLKGIYSYAPGQNPRNRLAPVPRPDFVVMRNGKMMAVLDAKYRDLWEKSLPREMLYQLSLYALGRPGQNRMAAILYPTMDSTAREQTLSIDDPVNGSSQAKVVLRPVKLLELEELIRSGNTGAKRRTELARWLSYGTLAA